MTLKIMLMLVLNDGFHKDVKEERMMRFIVHFINNFLFISMMQ